MKMLKLTAFTGEEDYGEDDQREENTAPVVIVEPATRIRSFSARKHGRPGTRIAFISNAGLPVRETVDEIMAALEALYADGAA